MTSIRRVGATLAALVLGSVAALTAVTPASAVSRYIGVDGREARCGSKLVACLYYSTYTSAYWSTNGNDSDLGNNYYISGTGSGAGQRVRNNSARMSCDMGVASTCTSYFSAGFTGNDDWMFYGQIGQLYYTWNDNASIETA